MCLKWTDRRKRQAEQRTRFLAPLSTLQHDTSQPHIAHCPHAATAASLLIAQVTEQLNKVRSATAGLQSELHTTTVEPDDDELEAGLAELEKAVPAAEKKLAAMKGGKDAMPAADVDALQREFNMLLAEWKKRRKGCREMIQLVAQNAAKSWKEKNFCVSHNAHSHTLIPRTPLSHSSHRTTAHHCTHNTHSLPLTARSISLLLRFALYRAVGGSGHRDG